METKYKNKIEFDGIVVEYTETENRYFCYIREHDMYFGSKDMETIEKKARFMVKAKANFLKDFPQYK